MQREILFRGKRKDNGEWIEGSLLLPTTDRIETQIVAWNGTRFNVIPETVGQYTGLKDVTGRRIFEKDIVTYVDFRGDHTRKSSIHDGIIPGWIGLIEWNENSGWYLDKDNIHNKEMLKARDSEKFNRQAPYIYYNGYINRVKPRVVGNRYDNQISDFKELSPTQPHHTTKI